MQLDAHIVFCFEGHALDVTRGCLRRGGSEIGLRPKAFAALRYLVENADRLVSKEEMIKAIWPDIFVTNDSLTQCVREIRIALGDHDQRIVKTVPRRGYLFAVQVSTNSSNCAVVATAGEAIGRIETPPNAPRRSIAVLPFTSLSKDPNQGYFADGLTDTLITDLSRIPGCFVIARHSTFAYKGKKIDVKRVGRQLGVRYLLEGSVQKSRDQVRVNAQLIDAQTGMHLWAERYDRNRAALLSIQDEITARIALSLNVALHDAEGRRGLQERPRNPDATDLIMRAWSIWHHKLAPENIAEALRLFEEALRIDSKSAEGLVGLARMHIDNVGGRWSDAREHETEVAEVAITRALALHPRNAMAHLTRGLILRVKGRLEEALIEFYRTLELNRNEVGAYVAIGNVKNLLGQAEEAIPVLEHALRLDPREHRINILAMLGWSHLLLGRDDDAIEWFRRSIHHNPAARRSQLWLACAYCLKGRDNDAQRAMAIFRKRMPRFTLSQNSAADASEHPLFVKQRERLYHALRKLGVPD
jgi:adenylate cyclase